MQSPSVPPPPAVPRPPGGASSRRVRWRWIVLGTAILVLAVVAIAVPIPIFYEYLPGPVRDVESLVQVHEAKSYSSEGELYLTTVSVDVGVTFVELVEGILDPQVAVVTSQEVTGGGSFEDLERQQRQEMQASKRAAREVALGALGYGEPEADGAKVLATLEGSPASQVLREDDVVLAVNEQEVTTSCQVGTAISQVPVGDSVEIEVERGDERQTVELETVENQAEPGSSLVGVLMEDINYQFTPGVEVEFETGRIAGPSAGLMFSLALYDRLTPDDLTAGKPIAGTGTIACDGGVGAIGGVEQKVAGAEAKGAEIFLAPAANFEAARSAADSIEVVSVSTFREAVEYLQGLS